jgi:hypothetical protein
VNIKIYFLEQKGKGDDAFRDNTFCYEKKEIKNLWYIKDGSRVNREIVSYGKKYDDFGKNLLVFQYFCGRNRLKNPLTNNNLL